MTASHLTDSSGLHYRRGDDAGWWMGDRRATLDEIGAARPKCPNRGRHWFTVYGMVGMRRPTCASCGAPNPTITEDQRAGYERWTSSRG